LELYGDGPERRRIEALVEQLRLGERVRVAGHRPEEDVAAALAHAGCLATASEREGYGLVVVEAAAHGTPSVVVAGPENAATELVHESVNGAVAADASPEQIGAALLRVVDAGPALRASTSRWFAETAETLRLDRSLAALLGLLSVVVLPAGALQLAVSREVSRRVASGEEQSADRFARAVLRLSVLATVPLLLVAFALAAPLAAVLHIHSVGVVVLAEAAFATALVFPVANGVLQGRQRFHALAALYVAPFVVRLAVLAVVAAAGYRLGGAVLATVLGSIGGTALALAFVREPLR